MHFWIPLLLLVFVTVPASAQRVNRCSIAVYHQTGGISITAFSPSWFTLDYAGAETFTEVLDTTNEWSYVAGEAKWRWNPTEPGRTSTAKGFIAHAIFNMASSVNSQIAPRWKKDGPLYFGFVGPTSLTLLAPTIRVVDLIGETHLTPGTYLEIELGTSIGTGNLIIYTMSVIFEQQSCAQIYQE